MERRPRGERWRGVTGKEIGRYTKQERLIAARTSRLSDMHKTFEQPHLRFLEARSVLMYKTRHDIRVTAFYSGGIPEIAATNQTMIVHLKDDHHSTPRRGHQCDHSHSYIISCISTGCKRTSYTVHSAFDKSMFWHCCY